MKPSVLVLSLLLVVGAVLGVGVGVARADVAPPDTCTSPGQPCQNAGAENNQAGTCVASTCQRSVPNADGGRTSIVVRLPPLARQRARRREQRDGRLERRRREQRDGRLERRRREQRDGRLERDPAGATGRAARTGPAGATGRAARTGPAGATGRAARTAPPGPAPTLGSGSFSAARSLRVGRTAAGRAGWCSSRSGWRSRSGGAVPRFDVAVARAEQALWPLDELRRVAFRALAGSRLAGWVLARSRNARGLAVAHGAHDGRVRAGRRGSLLY